MPEPKRVIIQMRLTPSLAAAGIFPPLSPLGCHLARLPGVEIDTKYSPVSITRAPTTAGGAFRSIAAGAVPKATATAEPTYVIRAAVQPERIDDFLQEAKKEPSVVGVFADARIQPIASNCPIEPVGIDRDVEKLLNFADLRALGMDGTGVRVVIVDTGVNLEYLEKKGKRPVFDANLSWIPLSDQTPGKMPVDHGTMCSFDVCIAAPHCTLVDHALLAHTPGGGSFIGGYLSDAVQSYSRLLSHLQAPSLTAGDTTLRTLVVNNSWGMFHPSWDFPVGSSQNYSDNPDHPFNIIVASLEEAGADLLFAAGNCGTECPDPRCEGLTTEGIFGANSHAAVLSVAGVTIDKQRIGYSTKGPGRLVHEKPDVACYTHFNGSEVNSKPDSGTSAATPVVAGVVAAIRCLYPASVVPPARLRELIRKTAEPRGGSGFNFEYGHGIINVLGLLTALEGEFGPVTEVVADKA